jgi:tRNA dimethylallyltransferase
MAGVFGGEIISADSRQVYKEMDIGTGKDLRLAAKIWGYDLVDPDKEFSVAQYRNYALNIIRHFFSSGILPILTGGTGLYIKAVVDGINTVDVPKNDDLRKVLEGKKPEELFESLAQMDPLKAASMNYSDKRNPRRLVRAIEIATWKIDNQDKENYGQGLGLPAGRVLFIGLTAPPIYLNSLIERRVRQRLEAGVEEEIKNLIDRGVSWEAQAMSALGYRQWRDYFAGKASREEAITAWKKEEVKYMRRQLTWFKNDKRINWFDVSLSGYEEKVESMVKRWYSKD